MAASRVATELRKIAQELARLEDQLDAKLAGRRPARRDQFLP